jgi:tRNA/rRNA methyltransferase
VDCGLKMNYFHVYILKCNDNSYYVGHTDNIENRISEHRSAKYRGYTSKRLPVDVVFVQSFGTRDEAFNAERQIKKWSRTKKEALIEGNFSKISLLAKKCFAREDRIE